MEYSGYQKGKRLRIFAGPNGSGKSTIFSRISQQYTTGYYINPDHIDKQLQESGKFNLSEIGLTEKLDEKFNKSVKTHSLAKKAFSENLPISLISQDGIIQLTELSPNSYNAAFISDFLRSELIRTGRKFSFESVMSHPSKLEFLEQASHYGYKNYLYFISTESTEINIERVKLRVSEHGHDVLKSKIRSRYLRSLELLYPAVTKCYRSFIFDNSGKEAKLICEVDPTHNIKVNHSTIPSWVYAYLLEKASDSYSIKRV